ncbi:MAG: glycoside hydrolase 100 family protein [Nitrospinaceae bacterium]
MSDPIADSAQALFDEAILTYKGQPAGTVAARGSVGLAAENYLECFVRDFFVSALVFLQQGRPEPVRNFLQAILECQPQQLHFSAGKMEPGVFPASFRVVRDKNGESLSADFGERAIGRVAPVDSAMWWVILLGIYVKQTGDRSFLQDAKVQARLGSILDLLLKDTFEIFPTLLVPDASFMIDRRMGVYGHPLEIQALFFGVLVTALECLPETGEAAAGLRGRIQKRLQALRSYVRIFYWLDLERLMEIHRFGTEEFGTGSVNMLNVFPDNIPNWVEDWLPDQGGYLVGNLGPGRMDFRMFSQGNLLAILFGLATPDQAKNILDLFEARWDNMMGAMPVKICYPAMKGLPWHIVTGSDPKNVPWSYHNGGNWPVLLWPFVAAALKAGRRDLAERACALAGPRLLTDHWPEYYDGMRGRLIGRRANLGQVWSAAGYLVARHLLKDSSLLALFPAEECDCPS